MATTTVSRVTPAKPPGKVLRWASVGLSAVAVMAALFMMTGLRPESGVLLDISEASSSLVVPIAFIVNVVSVIRRHRSALDITSLVISALLFGLLILDAAIYTLTPPG